MPRLLSTLALRLIVLISFLNLSLTSAQAANRATRTPGQSAANFQSWMAGVLRSQSSFAPGSPDNWLGGTGNWSTGADWSAGEPGGASDVTIATGNDNVTLDVTSSINSLTLGGTSGTSMLSTSGNSGLSIAGALTINPSGTLTLNGASVSAGGPLMNAGTVNLNSGSSLQGGNIVNSGGIALNVGFVNATGTLTNSGSITGVTNISGVGAATVINSGTILAYSVGSTGDFTNEASSLVSAQHLSVGGNLVNMGGVSGFMRGTQMNVTGELVNSGGFDTSYAVATVGTLSNSGGITVGEFTVIGDATNSGGIQLSFYGPSNGQFFQIGGTLNNTSTGGVSITGPFVSGSAANLNNSGTVELLNGGTFSTGNATNSGQIMTFQGQQGGNTLSIRQLTNNGGGVLSLGGMGDVANIGYVNNAGSVSIANGATLDVTGGSHASANAFPGFLNSGTVLISSGGTYTSPLTFTQTSGQTTVDGTLRLNGNAKANFAGGSVYGNGGTIQANVISNAAFNVGDMVNAVGQMAIMGNYTQGANGSLTFDIASLTQFDQLNVSGHAGLNGTLFVDLLNGYVPQIGNMFDIMNFSGESGTFSMVLGLPINNQEHFVLEYNSTDLTLDVVSGPELEASTGHSSSSGHSSSYTEPYITPGTEQAMNLAATSYAGDSTVPEPGSMVLLVSGVLGILGVQRKLV